jgi:hypothetical protein
MRKRKPALELSWIASCLSVAGLLLAAPAAAVDEEEAAGEDAEEESHDDFYSRPGVYLLAQFSNNILLTDNGSTTRTDAGEYSTGAAGAFGYRFSEHLAAELAGDWVSGWDARVAGQSKDLVGGTYGVNVKGYLKGGRVQPYGLLGLGATFMQTRNTQVGALNDAQWDMGIRVGFGLDWYVNEGLGLNVAPTFVIPVGANSHVGPGLTYMSIAIGGFIRFGDQ